MILPQNIYTPLLNIYTPLYPLFLEGKRNAFHSSSSESFLVAPTKSATNLWASFNAVSKS